jgi:endonuclease YncB( thermonuclease family)
MKWAATGFGAIATLLAGTAAATAAATAPCTVGRAPAGTVVEAVDGATLRLADGRVVTLAGIEAPTAPPGRSQPASPVAEAARHGLALATANGIRVAIIGDKPDRYGRWRGNVFAGDGTWLAQGAVAAGLARVHRLPGDPPCVLALLDTERPARIAGRGLWSDPEHRIRSANDPSLVDETGLYRLVAGRVASIGRGDVIVFVNFGRDFSRDFTVMLTPVVATGLAAAGIDVDALAGRRVLVRGMIEAGGGPAIRLADPTDIELLGDGDE